MHRSQRRTRRSSRRHRSAGAQVFLDQKLVGATPLKIRSTTGPHEVKLSLDGYVPRVARPSLPTDRDFELRIAVVLKPVRGRWRSSAPPTSRSSPTRR